MRDYNVEIVRRGRILMKADSVEEAVLIASRFKYQSLEWDDKYEVHAEAVQMPKQETADKPSRYGKGFRQKQKKKKRSQRYCPDEFPEEIPF